MGGEEREREGEDEGRAEEKTGGEGPFHTKMTPFSSALMRTVALLSSLTAKHNPRTRAECTLLSVHAGLKAGGEQAVSTDHTNTVPS
mmetsp:Transcript_2287/g.4720  ORF Transcript_2287/g.4720 Transcript_2287/m.4720 type:complete len:87 (-) Transcript_2287:66-326(-)